jgi:hypothetical protein
MLGSFVVLGPSRACAELTERQRNGDQHHPNRGSSDKQARVLPSHVAALLLRTVEHDAEPAAVALECDNRHALDLALDNNIVGNAILPKAEDVLVTARSAILDEERQHRVRPAACVDAQAKRKLGITGVLQHP